MRKLAIEQPNHVWCANVTYLPMRRGFLDLVAIMDGASGKVLVRRLSNTMDAYFCVAALGEALARFGEPEVWKASLQALPSPACCVTPACASEWVAEADG